MERKEKVGLYKVCGKEPELVQNRNLAGAQKKGIK